MSTHRSHRYASGSAMLPPTPGPTARLTLTSRGRGGRYSVARGLVESALRVIYQDGWAARTWGRVPGATRVRLAAHGLPVLPKGPARDALRVAFASDLHLGPTTPPALLDRAFAMLAALAPDVLVLGGDYVFLDATPARAAELERRVAAVPARTKVAVLGNHDLWTDHPVLEAALTRAGATVLVNEAVRLPAPYGDVSIVGLDDPWTGAPDAARAFAAAGDAALRLAVCHSPDGLPLVRGRGAALLLCGHTHGGQVALPGPRPLVVPSRMGKVYPWGLHDLGDLALFVSRGLGGVEVPVRSWAPPDIALFTLGV